VTEADWPAVNIAPERHQAYAAQWFLMAAALLAVFTFGGTNLVAWLRYRRNHGSS
jgi:surfeit locus 1 family protein